MLDDTVANRPAFYDHILAKSAEIGFNTPSDLHIGSLLKTLVCSKPEGRFLELGTGPGLSLSWMIDGMDEHSKIISIDNDPQLTGIAESFFGKDERVELLCTDGSMWLKGYSGEKFDLIFADAWPGKYSELDEVLGLLKVGGFYVIDDMSRQPNWPEGHAEKADNLISRLKERKDLQLTLMQWSTGVVLGTKVDFAL